MSITSEEVNFLVYRYLLESGFSHSAFSFGNESLLTKSNISSTDVPPGSLVAFLQKGLQFVEIEQHLNDDGSLRDCKEPFTLLTPHVCSAKSRKRKRSEGADAKRTPKVTESPRGTSTTPKHVDRIHFLRGHSSEVFVCAWSPNGMLLATGAGDGSACIWKVSKSGGSQIARLSHTPAETPPLKRPRIEGEEPPQEEEPKFDVTTMAWDSRGERLGTGCYDGIARIWKADGALESELKGHRKTIFSLNWCSAGDMVVTGSFDCSAIVWDAAKKLVLQRFEFHQAPIMDVQWRPGRPSQFASGSADTRIVLCGVGQSEAIKLLDGHEDEVNVLRWNASGDLLASGADDGTVKIWQVDHHSPLMHDLRGHTQQIFDLSWDSSPSKATVVRLASASFDATIRIWDATKGECIQKLVNDTQKPFYSVDFHPGGKHLATGSIDCCVRVWKVGAAVEDGQKPHSSKIVKSFRGGGGIFQVVWSPDGEMLVACFADGCVGLSEFGKGSTV